MQCFGQHGPAVESVDTNLLPRRLYGTRDVLTIEHTNQIHEKLSILRVVEVTKGCLAQRTCQFRSAKLGTQGVFDLALRALVLPN